MSSVKERVAAIAPTWLTRIYRRVVTAREFWSDYRLYADSTAWHFGAGRDRDCRDDSECLESRIRLAYHGLEKGVTFPVPKRPYGLTKAQEVADLLRVADKQGYSPSCSELALEAVSAAENFNATGEISGLIAPKSEWDQRALDPSDIESFVASRHSVRNFNTTVKPKLAEIRKIVSLAATSPSVCNRRAFRVHYYDDRDEIRSLLELQNGNRGFGQTIPGLFVITVRRSSFVGAGERNQRWIDGGLFAMSLAWICHAYGLGTCFLNWSQTNHQSALLRRVGDIPLTEDIVTYLAVGHPAQDHRVARSPLRPLDEMLVCHRHVAGDED